MKVMMTIQSEQTPSLAQLQDRFGLSPSEVDAEFGVIEIDPSDKTYAFMIEQSAASKIDPSVDWTVSGPYSNPRIDPFGPPTTL